MLLLHSLSAALLASTILAQIIIGTPIYGNYTKDEIVERGQPPSTGMTNAERLHLGMQPKFPRKLSGILDGRARAGRNRIVNGKRAPACPSGAPIVIPTKPVQVNPTVLYTGNTANFDDVNTPVTLSFPVNVFGTVSSVVYVGENGVVSLSSFTVFNNEPLYAPSPQGAAVFPFWDDLYIKAGTVNQVTVQSSATDFSVRWRVTTYADRATATGNDLDFTLYYTTATPGRWYAYYDVLARVSTATGSSATIGAQGSVGSNLFTQYSYNTANVVRAGGRLAFDTQCSGSTTVG